MARFFQQVNSWQSRKYLNFFLAFIWILGLHCGAALFHFLQIPSFSLMRGATVRSVSIVNLLVIALLPFLFSFFAVYIRSVSLLILLCYIKGCLFAFVSMVVYCGYGSAGWLIRFLIMFSDIFCMIPLWWVWIRGLELHSRHLLYSAVAVTAIIVLDHCFISQIIVRLLEI